MTGEKKEEGCVFCNRLDCDDAEHFVLHRGEHWFMLLNLYPYNSGHVLLVLNRHVPKLGECSAAEVAEMGILLSVMEAAIDEAFQPDGINCGYNGGSSAGAGIPEHIHLHMLPRWQGDTNFMSTIGETRVMPQTLPQAYEKLKPLVQRIVSERA